MLFWSIGFAWTLAPEKHQSVKDHLPLPVWTDSRRVASRCSHSTSWLQLAVLVVVHTYREEVSDEVVRIISARPATRRERKLYAQTIG